jgi:hypothetical protein
MTTGKKREENWAVQTARVLGSENIIRPTAAFTILSYVTRLEAR